MRWGWGRGEGETGVHEPMLKGRRRRGGAGWISEKLVGWGGEAKLHEEGVEEKEMDEEGEGGDWTSRWVER